MNKVIPVCLSVILIAILSMTALSEKLTPKVTYTLLTKNVVYKARETSIVELAITNNSDQPHSVYGYGFLAEGFKFRSKSGKALLFSDWVSGLLLKKRTEPKIIVHAKSTVSIMYFLGQLVKDIGEEPVIVEWKWGEDSAGPIIIAEPML